MERQDTYTITFNFTVKGDSGICRVNEELLEEWSSSEHLEEMIREQYDLWDEDLKVEISDIKIEEEEW